MAGLVKLRRSTGRAGQGPEWAGSGDLAASASGSKVRSAVVRAGRSEGPKSALCVEMCMVQQSGFFGFEPSFLCEPPSSW